MKKIVIQTNKNKEVINLTKQINEIVRSENIKEGVCQIFVLHTTCGLTTADLDPGTDQDYLTAIEKMFPKGNYNHPHDPSHVGDHIMSSVIGNHVCLPVVSGKLELGTWQEIVLIELSGPRDRTLLVNFI